MKLPEYFTSGGNQDFRNTKMLVGGGHVIDLDTEKVIIDYRFYTPKKTGANGLYAAIWIHDNKGDRHAYGTAKVTGAGYHYTSAAISQALKELGVTFNAGEDPDSGGTQAQEAALNTLARCLGYDHTLLVSFGP
jgi:hypothetical protein